MSDTATMPEQPANLSSLHRELFDLAARSKPASQDRKQVQGPVLVIRGK